MSAGERYTSSSRSTFAAPNASFLTRAVRLAARRDAIEIRAESAFVLSGWLRRIQCVSAHDCA